MKRSGWLASCTAMIVVLAVHLPVSAGQSGGSNGNGGSSGYCADIKCVVAFAKTFPKVLSDVVACADPASISVQYNIDAAHLKYGAKICFCARKDCKIGKYRICKGKRYCIVVKCGRVYSCNESGGQPS